MSQRLEPKDIFKEIKNNFLSLELFESLVQLSALYYQQHGSLDVLKLFIPANNQKSELHYEWSLEKADLAANKAIEVFAKYRISNAYIKEVQDDGIYLAFKTETPQFLSIAEYVGEASYIIGKAKINAVKITADDWLKDFPYEFHSSWYNRDAASREISLWCQESENEILAKALYDGNQNWLENYKYSNIDNWEPKGKFTELFKWADSDEENQRLIKEFRANYN